jgi:hypothetical protein
MEITKTLMSKTEAAGETGLKNAMTRSLKSGLSIIESPPAKYVSLIMKL